MSARAERFSCGQAMPTRWARPTARLLFAVIATGLTACTATSTDIPAARQPSATTPAAGAPAGTSAAAGDITYYAPWGNLAIFYQGSGYASGLVKLGSIASGVEALANQQGSFTATIDRADQRPARSAASATARTSNGWKRSPMSSTATPSTRTATGRPDRTVTTRRAGWRRPVRWSSR